MELLQATLKAVRPLNRNVMEIVQRRLNSLAKPPGSLGRLEEIAGQYAGVTGQEWPKVPRKCLVVAAADHGVAQNGVSAYPVETTVQMTHNYLLSKGAGANALAKFCGADLVVVDMGIKAELPDLPGLLRRKVGQGTGDFTRGPAMTRRQAVQALETGIRVAGDLAKQGFNCIGIGEMGIGNTTSSAAVAAAFGGLSPERSTGRGTGISDDRLKVKVEAVRRGLAVNKPDPEDAVDVLAKVGGFETGGLAGIILGAAANSCLVVVDGLNAGAAALISQRLQPSTQHYLLASHLSAEPAHATVLEMLGLRACIELGMRLGEGTGAALAMNLLDAAIRMLGEMATFEEAGVSQRDEGDCQC